MQASKIKIRSSRFRFDGWKPQFSRDAHLSNKSRVTYNQLHAAGLHTDVSHQKISNGEGNDIVGSKESLKAYYDTGHSTTGKKGAIAFEGKVKEGTLKVISGGALAIKLDKQESEQVKADTQNPNKRKRNYCQDTIDKIFNRKNYEVVSTRNEATFCIDQGEHIKNAHHNPETNEANITKRMPYNVKVSLTSATAMAGVVSLPFTVKGIVGAAGVAGIAAGTGTVAALMLGFSIGSIKNAFKLSNKEAKMKQEGIETYGEKYQAFLESRKQAPEEKKT